MRQSKRERDASGRRAENYGWWHGDVTDPHLPLAWEEGSAHQPILLTVRTSG
jgi:hypothetical protein